MRKARAHAKRKGGRGSADEVQGWVQLSIELVPEFLAKQTPVGQGRSDPNDYPYLAPPVNRFQSAFDGKSARTTSGWEASMSFRP